MDWLLRDTTNELGEHQTLFDSYIEHMAALRDKLQKHCAKHNGRYKSMCVAWVVAAGWLFGRLSHRCAATGYSPSTMYARVWTRDSHCALH